MGHTLAAVALLKKSAQKPGPWHHWGCLHNLERDELALSLREIERVYKGKSFITVDAYRNDEEKEAMYAWNLTAKTILHVDEWKKFFREVGYTGDYFWFVP